jgi:hypothetical protein
VKLFTSGKNRIASAPKGPETIRSVFSSITRLNDQPAINAQFTLS